MGALPRRGRLPLVDWQQARRVAIERLHTLGLDDLDVDVPVGALSVVEQAFVQIASVLGPATKVIILDEPTAPMDADEVARTLSVLQRVKRSGVAIIYISHRLHEIFEICDRVAVLS